LTRRRRRSIIPYNNMRENLGKPPFEGEASTDIGTTEVMPKTVILKYRHPLTNEEDGGCPLGFGRGLSKEVEVALTTDGKLNDQSISANTPTCEKCHAKFDYEGTK
jgi:hypothetical protein